MNCDPRRGRFFGELMHFTNSHALVNVDIEQLPMNSYTYISYSFRATTSWFDHVLSSKREIVSDVCIRYGFAFGDHIPLQFSLVLQFPCTVVKRAVPRAYACRQFTFWHKFPMWI